MFAEDYCWPLSVSLIVVLWIFLLARKGPVAALGTTMVFSFVFPVWITIDVAGAPINIRTATAIINMSGFLLSPRRFHPQGKILRPLTLLDCCIAMMCITHIASDTFASGFALHVPFRAYGEWALPYVAGRYAVSSRNDLKLIAKCCAAVLVLLGVLSCVEALTKVNPFEFVFGNRPTELAPRLASRFGLKRAFGPSAHPIFLGMTIAVLMPWLTCLWQTSQSRQSRGLTAFAGVIALAGTFMTGSRTPLLTIFGAVPITATLRFRWLRWPVGLFFATMVAAFSAFPEKVTDEVSRWTGGGDRFRLIEIDGKAEVTSSSRSRLHYFGVYSDALVQAGLFGYGSEATSGFPLKIPNMEAKFKSRNLFEMVDNAYILSTLRFGWLGGACLAMLFLTAIGTGISLSREYHDELFPFSVACLLVIVAGFSLLLVFMSYDFGLPLLWTIGILSGLASLRLSGADERNPDPGAFD